MDADNNLMQCQQFRYWRCNCSLQVTNGFPGFQCNNQDFRAPLLVVHEGILDYTSVHRSQSDTDNVGRSVKRAREPLSLHACTTTGQQSSSQNRYGQAVKAQFGRSKFLTAVADVSTGPIGVTTPCGVDHHHAQDEYSLSFTSHKTKVSILFSPCLCVTVCV